MSNVNECPTNCHTTLEKSLETLQYHWNIEAAQELSDWSVEQTMETILVESDGRPDDGEGNDLTESRSCRSMRRRQVLAQMRCKVGDLIDSIHKSRVIFITMMSLVATSAMPRSPVVGAFCLAVVCVVSSRAVYAELRNRFTWWRLRQILPNVLGKSTSSDDRFSDTPLFEEVGRYATPKVLEELKQNLELLRAQHHWRVSHLDRRVFKEEEDSSNRKDAIEDEGIPAEASDNTTRTDSVNVGRHRQQQFPYLLPDEEREAS